MAGILGGVVALMLYLATYYGIYDMVYAPLEIWSGDPGRLIGDILLTALFSAFFALLTGAFMLLRMDRVSRT